MISKLKDALLSLSEASNKECSKVLSDATQKIKSEAKLSDGKQKTVTQQIIDTKKAFNEQLRQNYEDEREKRKVLLILYCSTKSMPVYRASNNRLHQGPVVQMPVSLTLA